MAAKAHINMYQLSRRAEMNEQHVRDLFDVILACMEEGVEVRIREFGTFVPEVKPARVVKSPLVEGGEKKLGRRRVMKLRMSRSLRRQWTEE